MKLKLLNYGFRINTCPDDFIFTGFEVTCLTINKYKTIGICFCNLWIIFDIIY